MVGSQDSPNIVLVMMDATRVDRLSCYGYERPTTPNIDRIASEGVVYEQAFAPEVWTLPVAASVFTGLMPQEHCVTFQHPRLPSRHPTLAGLLAQQGYTTLGISSNAWTGSATGLDRGFSDFWEPYRLLSGATWFRVTNWINRFYIKYIFHRYDKGARRINRFAKRWLRRREISQVDRPFFMFVHYLEPHSPYRPPQPFDALYLEDRNLVAKAKRINHHALDFFAGRITLNEQDFEVLNRLYDAEIAYTDAQFGQLYKTLEETGLLERTAVILFADHGENIGHHGLLDHHFCLYDSLIHVPLIIRYPPQFPRGQRVEELVQIQDIFRTLSELAGLADHRMPRLTRSLRIEEVRENPRGYVIAQTSEANLSNVEKRKPVMDISCYDRRLWAVRTSRYKYVEGSDGSTELYDLQVDPNEHRNIAHERPNDASKLQRILRREFPMQAQGQDGESSGDVIDDPTVLERLRSLGYID